MRFVLTMACHITKLQSLTSEILKSNQINREIKKTKPIERAMHCIGVCCVFSHSVVSSSLCLHGLQPARLFCPWGFSRQEHWSGLPCPPPADLPSPGIEPRSPALQVDSLPSQPPRKSIVLEITLQINEERVQNGPTPWEKQMSSLLYTICKLSVWYKV